MKVWKLVDCNKEIASGSSIYLLEGRDSACQATPRRKLFPTTDLMSGAVLESRHVGMDGGAGREL